jgi:hypothetical protein
MVRFLGSVLILMSLAACSSKVEETVPQADLTYEMRVPWADVAGQETRQDTARAGDAPVPADTLAWELPQPGDLVAPPDLPDLVAADVPPDLPDVAPELPCQPDCQDKDCGDDGCGGNCGTCTGQESCIDSLCVCQPDCMGAECGSDGCGGQCGECPANDVCLVDATCCTPECEGKDCGMNGCGGSCGQCDGNGFCQDGLCCYPQCENKVCGDDGCGGTCGQCLELEMCDDGTCVIDPEFIGCSDGTREGFLKIGGYPLLAACGGAWDIPGIHNVTPACNREAGNSGANAPGTGCNVADLCAEGWHVCLGKNDVDYRSPLGCLEIMDGAQSPAFFLVRTSSTGAFNCAPDTIGDPTSVNDLFGCGDLGCSPDVASCEPLDMASHDLCKAIRNKPTSGCTCYFYGELPASDPNFEAGNFTDVKCTPSSGGCGWCKPLDYYNKKLGVSHPNAWDCGTNSTKEALNVVKSHPDQQGGVLCCKDQCATDTDCDIGMVCVMSTCQVP